MNFLDELFVSEPAERRDRVRENLRLFLYWLIVFVLLKLVIVLNNYDVLYIKPFINLFNGFANRSTFWYNSIFIQLLLTAIELNIDLAPVSTCPVSKDPEVLVYALELRSYLLVKFEPLILFC